MGLSALWTDVLRRGSQSWLLGSTIAWISGVRWPADETSVLAEPASTLMQAVATIFEFANTLRPGSPMVGTAFRAMRDAGKKIMSSGQLVPIIIKLLTTKVNTYLVFIGIVLVSASLALAVHALLAKIKHMKVASLLVPVGVVLLSSWAIADLSLGKEVALELQVAAPVVRAICVARLATIATSRGDIAVICMQAAPLVGRIVSWLAIGVPEDPLAPVVASAVAVAIVSYHAIEKGRIQDASLILAAAAITLSPRTVDYVVQNHIFDNAKAVHAYVTLLNVFLLTILLVFTAGTPLFVCFLVVVNVLLKLHDVDFEIGGSGFGGTQQQQHNPPPRRPPSTRGL